MKQNIYLNFLWCVFSILFCTILSTSTVLAGDLSSSSFIIRDPVIGTGGGFSSSGTFQLVGSGDTIFTGYNSSSSFIGEYGFLYFPSSAFVTPVTPPSTGGGGGGLVKNGPIVPGVCGRTADFNCDGYVDILDLSILLYYTDKASVDMTPYDLSQDGIVDLADISILFYYWDL